MSWQLERRDGEWHVLGEDGSSAGSHNHRADAIKQQRALYAREAMVASMYEQLDAQPVVEIPQLIVPDKTPVVASALSPFAAELVGMLLKDDREKSLVASMVDSQAQARLEAAEEDRRALVAALQTLGSPVVNVPATVVNVDVPPAEVSVNVPPAEVTVNTPEVRVDVAAPQVTVRPEINMPSVQKTVTLERDPLTREVIKAEVTEN